MNMDSLPIVPPSRTVNTSEEDGPIQVQEKFFASILTFLGFDSERKIACFTEREDRVLSNFGPVTPMYTDNRITVLIVRGVLVASALYWRNDANYVCVAYAHYLTEDVIKRARWHEMEEER